MSCIRVFMLTLAVSALAWAVPASAQTPAPAPDRAFDPDRAFNVSQPDFAIVNLPTTLRVPVFKSAFRVTHRFGRPLGAGDFGSLVEDAFGLDSGAQIGLEYRFGLAPGAQIGIHRTSNRTIEFFGQYSLVRPEDDGWFGLGVWASVDGTNNFRDTYSPALGVVLSHELGDHGALYVEPIWVNNSNPLPDVDTEDNDSLLFGLGARIRIRPTLYLVGEAIPRIGYRPGATYATFGLEKRAGGHSFQLNFSNGFGTTMGQLARGGTASDDWYLGFNISRKFF